MFTDLDRDLIVAETCYYVNNEKFEKKRSGQKVENCLSSSSKYVNNVQVGKKFEFFLVKKFDDELTVQMIIWSNGKKYK